MESLFLYLWGRSASAAVVIAAVLLLRFLLRDAPKAFRMILWAVVAIRLLCPYTPESRLSLMPDWTPVRAVDVRAVTPAPYPIPAHDVESPATANRATASESGYAAPENNAPQIPLTLTQTLSGAWLCGFCALLAYSLYSYLKVRRTVSASLPAPDGFRICDDIPSPFVLGVLRPCVYVPSGLSEPELSCVLKHENAHIRRGDPCWALLAWLTACLYWFHPLVWLSYALFRRDMELACDETAICDMDAARRAVYAETLLNCGLRRGGISLAFGETGVKERVKAALRYRKPALWLTGVASVVCVAAALCFLTRPASGNAQALETPDDGETTAALSDSAKTAATLPDAEAMTPDGAAARLLNVGANALESGKEPLLWVRNDEGGNWENLTETRKSIEFPGVTFQWTPEKVTATGADGAETALFYGMPVWSVYFADLNGDGYSELCSMVSVGSGIIDERIVVYDFKAGKNYELQDRFYHNYTLSAENGVLKASMWMGDNGERSSAPLLTGTLRLVGENLVIVPAYPESIGNESVQREYGVSPEWDSAIREAIIAHDRDIYAAGEFDAESHVILGMDSFPSVRETDGASTVTFYLMSLHESFSYRGGRFTVESGRSGPVALTFRVENGTPTLTEYWEPRDGPDYWSDVREKFPASLSDKELDTQTYIMGQYQEIYSQVVEHWNIDTAPILDALFDEFKEPALSSNPGDYLDANPLALRKLLYYGEYTRAFIWDNIGANGAAQGLRRELMRLVLERLEGLTWAEPGAFKDLSGLGNLTHATLTHLEEHIGPAPGTYSLSDLDKLLELAELLRNAEPLNFATKCPFDDVLTLTDEYGNAVQLALAADSCSAYRFAGRYFKYGADDSALYALFA